MNKEANAKTTTDELVEGIDLSDKHILITGASGGLGLETARALAKAGAEVVIAARKKDKMKQAIELIKEKLPQAKVSGRELDLASTQSIKKFAEDFVKEFSKLDVLINNAGVMACPFAKTADGFEMQFGTNHLGHFLLTNLLRDLLLASGDARIVCLSSGGHKYSDIIYDDPNFEKTPYDKWLAYGQAKTANSLFSVALDERLKAKGCRSFAVHPGVIMTDLGRHLTEDDIALLSSGSQRGRLVMKPVECGAATSVWAAISPSLNNKGGLYLEDCAIAVEVTEGEQQHGYYEYAVNKANAEKLWDLSNRLLGESF